MYSFKTANDSFTVVERLFDLFHYPKQIVYNLHQYFTIRLVFHFDLFTNCPEIVYYLFSNCFSNFFHCFTICQTRATYSSDDSSTNHSELWNDSTDELERLVKRIVVRLITNRETIGNDL